MGANNSKGNCSCGPPRLLDSGDADCTATSVSDGSPVFQSKETYPQLLTPSPEASPVKEAGGPAPAEADQVLELKEKQEEGKEGGATQAPDSAATESTAASADGDAKEAAAEETKEEAAVEETKENAAEAASPVEAAPQEADAAGKEAEAAGKEDFSRFIALGDTVSLDGRAGVVNWDQRPKGEFVSVLWVDDGTESDVIALSKLVLVEKAAAKPVGDAKSKPQKEGKSSGDSTKKSAEKAEKAKKEKKETKEKGKKAAPKKKSYLQKLREEKAEYERRKPEMDKLVEDIMAGKYKTEGGGQPQGNMEIKMPTPADRLNTRTMVLEQFRVQYRRIGKNGTQACPSAGQPGYGGVTPSTGQPAANAGVSAGSMGYSNQETEALQIVGGHVYMERPLGVELPKDFRKHLKTEMVKTGWRGSAPKYPEGVIDLQTLSDFGCKSNRKLVSVYGDIFDVSDRPDKYAENAPYAWMTGNDITWGFVSGKDVPETVNKCYDLWKVAPETFRDSKLRTIYAWVAFYEFEYGDPVGRLNLYENEAGLKGPPMEESQECSIM